MQEYFTDYRPKISDNVDTKKVIFLIGDSIVTLNKKISRR